MTEARLRGQAVFYWNPRRNHLPFLRRFEVGPRVRNFGDLLGPLVVARLVGASADAVKPVRGCDAPRVFSVGSVLHFARDGDVVWGTGVNGKIDEGHHNFDHLDVRAVRGPLTREWLLRVKGIETPEIYGDPALLLPEVAPETVAWADKKRRRLGVVPNFHDVDRYSSHPGFIDPRRAPWEVIRDILESEMIAASSLHGVIVAEAYGIPAALLPPGREQPFKYDDYAAGSERDALLTAADPEQAESRLPKASKPLSGWDSKPLLGAFPRELFTP